MTLYIVTYGCLVPRKELTVQVVSVKPSLRDRARWFVAAVCEIAIDWALRLLIAVLGASAITLLVIGLRA